MSKEVDVASDTVLAGQLPERTWQMDEQTRGQNTYSCNFGFQQEIYDLPVIDDPFFGGNIQNQCSVSDPCYLTQGSNDVPPIRTSTGLVSRPILPELERAASDTDTSNFDVFRHFPDGSDSGDNIRDGEQSGLVRDPLTVCRNVNNLCN